MLKVNLYATESLDMIKGNVMLYITQRFKLSYRLLMEASYIAIHTADGHCIVAKERGE